MRLTPRALQLRPEVDQLCSEIERLFEPVTFDPATADAQFVIAAPDHLAFLLGKALLGRLHETALLAMDPPNVARAPASLARFLSAILPLKVLNLTGEDDRVDTGMFWSQVHDATPAQVWLRTVVQESVSSFDALQVPGRTAQSGPSLS